MRIKEKNIMLLIFQAVSMLLLFFPGLYTRVYMPQMISGAFSERSRFAESFFDKMDLVLDGKIIGVLAVTTMLVVLVIFIIQVSGKKHIPAAGVLSFFQMLLFSVYSFAFSSRHLGEGDSASRHQYEPAFWCFVVIALLIAIFVIAAISNKKIKDNGIIE